MKIFDRWNHFWSAPYSLNRLALFRILISLVVLAESVTKISLLKESKEVLYFGSGFYISYLSFLTPPPFFVFLWMGRMMILCSVTAAAGLFTRASFLILGGILSYIFFLDQTFYLNHIYFLGLAVFLAAFMPCGKKLSCDALISRLRSLDPPPPRASAWAARLLQATLSLMYFFSAVSKSRPAWWSGDVLQVYHDYGVIQVPNFIPVLAGMSFAWLGRVALLTEYFLAWALWLQPLRIVALIVGMLFHGVMDLSMDIGTFSIQVLLIYLLFCEPSGQKTSH